MTVQKTPIYDEHLALGAKMVNFSAWSMPVFYEKITSEHLHVREHAGLFDVSHMGEFFVTGSEAKSFLQRALINDLDLLSPGQSQYTALLNEKGGMIDDLLVYQLEEEEFLLCVNASNIEKDFTWLAQLKEAFPEVNLSNASKDFAQLAVQGPKSLESLSFLSAYSAKKKIEELSYGEILEIGDDPSKKLYIARTGYTGEKGFELYIPKEQAVECWRAILATSSKTNIKPVGLGARDTLRLEACYPLYGNEMNDTVSPLEIGIGWATKMKKDIKFIGHEALSQQKEEGLKRRLYAFHMLDSGIARLDMKVFQNGEEIGTVTSGSMLPSLGKKGGLALLESQKLNKDEAIEIDIRGQRKKATLTKKPMYQAKIKS